MIKQWKGFPIWFFKIMGKGLLRLAFLFVLLPFLTGCGNLLYLSHLGWYQSFITFRSVSVEEVLRGEVLGDEEKARILYIQEVKRFGEERLGLKKSKSYTKFYEREGVLLYIITASEKDRLVPYYWHFPIIGEVTYKGFFTLEDVMKEKLALERKGLDTYIQGVGAYSTLGWLKDPIFSHMLSWDLPTLTNVILHEMAHGTLYFKGETDFNEQLATFIGNQGTIEFLKERFGTDSKELSLAMDNQHDDLLFSEWIEKVYQYLSDFYAQPISKEEKLEKREGIFRFIQSSFREIKDRFRTDCYRDFDQRRLNNAVILAHRRYLYRMDRFEALYESLGREMKRLIQFFENVKRSGEKPALYLERWIRERGITSPSSLQ